MVDLTTLDGWLRRCDLSEEDVNKRLRLVGTLNDEVYRLMADIPNFKGLVLLGSILKQEFRGNSDIDTYLYWLDKTVRDYPHLRNMVKLRLSSTTERMIHIVSERDSWYPHELLSGCNIDLAGVSFGAFVGDDAFMTELRKEILIAARASRKHKQWAFAQDHFNSWGYRDLSNPDEDYRLSDFQKLSQGYGIE